MRGSAPTSPAPTSPPMWLRGEWWTGPSPCTENSATHRGPGVAAGWEFRDGFAGAAPAPSPAALVAAAVAIDASGRAPFLGSAWAAAGASACSLDSAPGRAADWAPALSSFWADALAPVWLLPF